MTNTSRSKYRRSMILVTRVCLKPILVGSFSESLKDTVCVDCCSKCIPGLGLVYYSSEFEAIQGL